MQTEQTTNVPNEMDYLIQCLNDYANTLNPSSKIAVLSMIQSCVTGVMQELIRAKKYVEAPNVP